jgi:hypothetical protein
MKNAEYCGSFGEGIMKRKIAVMEAGEVTR